MTTLPVCPDCGAPLGAPGDVCPACPDVDIDENPTVDMQPEVGVLEPGSEIAERYRVLATLGRGGFAVVYRALDERLGRQVAIKRLADSCDPASPEAKRFEAEARVLANLDHPHVVPIYDAGFDLGHPYLSMKLVEGRPLARKIRDGALPEDDALAALRDLTGALGHAHARGVLHRDVKPSNVLVDGDGNVFLADFGLSTGALVSGTFGPGVLAGTLPYMAPEALRGTVSVRSDLYALGAVLHEMLFQRPPVEDDDLRRLMQRIGEVPETLRSPPVDLSEPCRGLLERLLAAEPAARPANADELLRELDKLLAPGGRFDVHREMASLEGLAGRLKELGERPTTDQVLDPLSRFLPEAAALVERLQNDLDDAGRDPVSESDYEAAVWSLRQLARTVERRLEAIHEDGRASLDGMALQLQGRVLAPLRELGRLLQESAVVAARPADDFFAFDEDETLVTGPEEDEEWIEDLFSSKELVRHEAVLTLVESGLPSFLSELENAGEERRNNLLDALWTMADVVLLEGRGRSRPLFETAGRLASPDVSRKWRQLYSLFQKAGGHYWDPEMVRQVLDSEAVEDRRVIARALLFHPWERYRRLALESLEPPDFWQVIVHEKTPVPWLLEVWRHLRPQVNNDYLKIFFVCCAERLRQGGGARRIVATVEMVKEFFAVDCFHENLLFRMLTQLEEAVRREAGRHRLLVDFDADFAERLRAFGETPARLDQPVSSWGKVPLPVQRLMARRGHFLRHFCSHPVQEIALECLPHLLRREDLSDFLKLFTINSKLLQEMARKGHLFQDEQQKYLLVANPKTPAFLVSKYVNFLRADSLRHLAHSPECNPFAREAAKRLIEMRERYRHDGPTKKKR